MVCSVALSGWQLEQWPNDEEGAESVQAAVASDPAKASSTVFQTFLMTRDGHDGVRGGLSPQMKRIRF